MSVVGLILRLNGERLVRVRSTVELACELGCQGDLMEVGLSRLGSAVRFSGGAIGGWREWDRVLGLMRWVANGAGIWDVQWAFIG